MALGRQSWSWMQPQGCEKMFFELVSRCESILGMTQLPTSGGGSQRVFDVPGQVFVFSSFFRNFTLDCGVNVTRSV